ncbi:MAG: DUF748 domain-containing protein [Deltaproteobacteria bacterium]|jgi:uncharacterized protein involved in outer membrane biogenesis/outer membrane protein OmpA-like peptidoglycan-associated protein|nr:DUF748 domain-containing protein [Deltaproteobacteria bacterium]
MSTWKRLLYACVLFVVLLFGFVSLILPGIIVDKAQSLVAKETGRTLSIGSMSINPIGLTVSIGDLSLSEADPETPFITWQKLTLSLSLKSLYYMAPVIDELQLDTPYVHLERLAENRFNFSSLIPKEDEPVDPETAGEPARFSINNLTIRNGTVELVDSSLDEQVRHSIHDLTLALPAIGNLPYMVDNPVQPMLHAIVNDAPVDVKGELKPFTEAREMRLNLSLDNIDLPFYLGYVPMELPVQLRNGRLSFDLELLYRLASDTGPVVELHGHIDLTSLDIRDRQNERLFFLPLMQVDIAPTRPLAKEIHLSTLHVYNLEVHLNRDRQGVWNHSRMAMGSDQPVSPETEHAPESEEQQPDLPLRLLIDDFRLRDGVVHFKDDVPVGGFATTAQEINIDLQNFDLDASEAIPFKLSLATKHEESVTADGDFLLDPFTLRLQTGLKDLKTAVYAPYYQDFYKVPLGGSMSVSARLDINPQQPLLVSQGHLAWEDAYMAFNKTEGMGIALLELTGLSFDMAENRLELASYVAKDGRVNFSRSDVGHWSLLSNNFPVLAKLTEAPQDAPPPASKDEAREFSYQIDELALVNWQFDVRDDMPQNSVNLQAREFNLTFRNLAAPEKVESPFEFSTRFGRKGQIRLNGTASLADQSLKMKGQLKNIALNTFAPYVSEQANLVLQNGTLNFTTQVSIAPAQEGHKVRFGGNLGISRFHLLDGVHREDLLKWDSLQIARINGQTAPLELSIESITLSDYFAKVLIDEEARLNLAEAFRKEGSLVGEEDAAGNSSATVAATDNEAEPETPRPIVRIDTVTLQGGQVDFTDRSLPRAFHADMQELGGRISGLNSDPAARAEVDLRGSLRGQSPLSVSGFVNPLAEKLFLDLKLSFRDIDLSPMSPYSGNYVGYLIEKGKLNLSLEYKVEDNQLKATNEVFLDQFTFGQSVESEQATSLPVKLAVALLKDRNGEIHLDIPVYGNLEDPQFSIAGVVWTIIKNLLVKAATSPFALLGAMLGGGEEDFSSIHFDYGTARLSPVEQDKLQRMSRALLDRPGLDVEVSGFVDPDNDPEGYRKEQLSTEIRRLKYLDLVEEEALPEGLGEDDVKVSAEEYADYLWQVYREKDFPKPRNFIGMTKKLPESEMEKLIYANTEVDEEVLGKLARERALAVQNFLSAEGQLPKERIFLKEPDITAAPDKETTTRARVELGASVQ